MKTVILYSSKSGATETCARMMSQQLEDCSLINVDKHNVTLSDYDNVILGSGIRIGKGYRSMRAFMKQNLSSLLEKPLWIYFCNADDDGFSEAVEKSVPPQLRQAAKGIVSLGGKPPFKSDMEATEWLKEDALNQLVQEVKTG